MTWKSNFFTRQEFACPCGDCATFPSVSRELVHALDEARAAFDCPVYITSGYRCPEWNKRVGGAAMSRHCTMPLLASDISVRNIAPIDVFDYFDFAYQGAYGLGLYNSHVHIDVRDYCARWDLRADNHERSEGD